MAAIPYMPFYVADYLADAGHLTTIQHGAYVLMLMNYWQRGKALPSSDAALMSITRLSKSDWSQNRETLMEFFTEVSGTLVNKRTEKELAKFRDKSSQSKSAANARWGNMQNDCDRNAEPMRTHMPPQCHTDTNTDTDKSKDKNTAKPTAAKSAAVSVSDQVEVWFSQEFWPVYPRREAKVAALRSARAVLRTPELRAAALRALTLQLPDLTSRPPDKRPHPATWINGRRWEDEAALPFISMPQSNNNGGAKVGFVESVEREFEQRYREGRL
jgi:uncharacterized protein YdaU (DUF1376 family)